MGRKSSAVQRFTTVANLSLLSHWLRSLNFFLNFVYKRYSFVDRLNLKVCDMTSNKRARRRIPAATYFEKKKKRGNFGFYIQIRKFIHVYTK